MNHSFSSGVVSLSVKGDEEGRLVVVEALTNLPFSIKRMFAIYGSRPGVVRGGHANRNSSFGFLCLAGSCRVRIFGAGKEVILDEELASPDKLFWIGPMVWKEMYDFSSDCVLTVLSDHLYDPEEYIHSFEDYETLLRY